MTQEMTFSERAPLDFSGRFSGAPVAQIECATGEFSLKDKSSGAERATASAALARQRRAPWIYPSVGKIARGAK